MKIIPSIASADQTNIQGELKRIGNCFENLHIDIEDGNFVSNITFGLKTIKAICNITDKPISVHLMVSNPEYYITKLKNFPCDIIFVHTEGQIYIRKLLKLIQKYGFKAGIALNPISNILDYEYLMPDIDAILYMTSEEDLEGENFNKNIVKKIKKFPQINIWVDGGITKELLLILENKHVDYVVMGREIFRNSDPNSLLEKLNQI